MSVLECALGRAPVDYDQVGEQMADECISDVYSTTDMMSRQVEYLEGKLTFLRARAEKRDSQSLAVRLSELEFQISMMKSFIESINSGEYVAAEEV